MHKHTLPTAMALNRLKSAVMLVGHDCSLGLSLCDKFWLDLRGGIAPLTAILTTTSVTCSTKPNAARRVEGLAESGEGDRRQWSKTRRHGRAETLKRDQGMLELQTRKHALEARLSKPLPTQEIEGLALGIERVDEERGCAP